MSAIPISADVGAVFHPFADNDCGHRSPAPALVVINGQLRSASSVRENPHPSSPVVMGEEGFRVCKKSLRIAQEQDVANARRWANDLTGWFTRGNQQEAWTRIEALYGIPYQTLWALKYRKPKEVASHILRGLWQAREAERVKRARQLAEASPDDDVIFHLQAAE